jgi:hypothetical protein
VGCRRVGDGGAVAAVRNAELGVELAATKVDGSVSARHGAKSDVVLAAALCSAGAIDRARTVGAAALELTGRLGLVPLRWAVACLLVELVDSGSSTCPIAELCDIRDECARQVQHWGGAWSPR